MKKIKTETTTLSLSDNLLLTKNICYVWRMGKIIVSIPDELLEITHRFCEENYYTRSEFFRIGIRAALKQESEKIDVLRKKDE